MLTEVPTSQLPHPQPQLHDPSQEVPTVWGLTPTELHDRFWAARGVQVVRPGQPSEIVEGAELFLLLAPRLLTLFTLRNAVERLGWIQPDILWVRIRDHREHAYREHVRTDDQGQFVAFERDYGIGDSRLSRVALTPHANVARLWQSAADPRQGWALLRERIPRRRRNTMKLTGKNFDRDTPAETMSFMRDLIQLWKVPSATVGRIHRRQGDFWADSQTDLAPEIRSVGPVWVGAGRRIDSQSNVIGPAVLWDDPAYRPQVEHVCWEELEPSQVVRAPLHQPLQSSFHRWPKRLFDLVFAAIALLLLLPLFPLIMLAIWIEDGRPFFFAHKRETLGSREFPCLKFRTMRRDAEDIKARLATVNQADGPQFYIKDDPRITRVGRFLRNTQLDELPQLLNILAGHMSIVGPRPSPRKENQYCPAWREARLSVRPGLTGLWQVSRSRRPGEDFQEWIRYDLQYVENASLLLDLKIIWKTIIIVIKGA